MLRLEPYKLASASSKAMAGALGVLRVTPKQLRKYGEFPLLINWGATERRFPNARYINNPEAVARACNKQASFEAMERGGVPTVPHTCEKATAQAWLEDGHSVVARRLLRANSGRGIVLVSPDGGETLPTAPLYTRYVKKADEYRVHVVGDTVVDFAQKKKRTEVDNEDVNYQIRNACNGWVFCREGVDPPDAVRDASVAAVRALGLDFGAVDVGWNTKEERPAVYEVNTAPGVEGTTLERYREAFVELLPQLNGGAYRRRRNV